MENLTSGGAYECTLRFARLGKFSEYLASEPTVLTIATCKYGYISSLVRFVLPLALEPNGSIAGPVDTYI